MRDKVAKLKSFFDLASTAHKVGIGKVIEMSSQIRILHLLSDKDKRVRPLENLVSGLDRNMFSQVICYLRGGELKHTQFVAQGPEVVNLGLSEKKLRGFRPSVLFQLARLLEERSIDIIHCQRHKPTVYGTLATFFTSRKPKVISHVRGLNRTRSFRRKLLNWMLFKRVSRIVAISHAVRDDILENNWICAPHKVVTVYNGITVKPFIESNLSRAEARFRLGLPETEGCVFGTVGRLEKTKGQRILLQAFARVYRKHPDTWLVLAGRGKLEAELQGLATELDIQKRVLFLGHRNDVPEVLKAYDAFVFPSIAEGLGLALLEAMATGIPVIASKVGGVLEILNRPGLGIMIPPTSVEALSNAMQTILIMEKEKRIEVGKALRQRVLEQFTKEKMISAMVGQYMEVMGEDRAGQRSEDG